ncbi:hypothetical protein HAHE_07550 [Haloferula helveola]|uniref:Uncharacterized protein n=1 Tax=Haloferula helveola TaxID=490095 RepID=A0ABN6H1M0_9BACT|nr:hypothetical protein HAHE_07550 [Haloferula helveola]
MNDSESQDPVAEKIAQIDARLEALEEQLHQIGRPAANHLFERLEALKIEDRALWRNFEEVRSHPRQERLEKLETLLRHIEREEASVEHEAAFLGLSAPSSVVLAAEAATKVADAVGHRVGKILHGHHPFGSSVFVNHSHSQLVDYHGLQEPRPPRDEGDAS